MKTLIPLIISMMLFASCATPGRWKWGNQDHFDQRAAAKARKQDMVVSDTIIYLPGKTTIKN